MLTVRESLHRIYVWELPVRLWHWANAFAMFALITTGFLIGRAWVPALAGEASRHYWFGTVRFLHFVASMVFFFVLVYRVYWALVGNRHASWKNFLLLRKGQRKEFLDVLKVDILQLKGEPLESVGHNALASVSYAFVFLAFVFQAVTGFGLYAAMSDWWLPGLFTWIVPLMGGDMAVRQWHHVMMWVFVVFFLVHFYLVMYHDYWEGRGIMSSMTSGWKFVEDRPARRDQAAERLDRHRQIQRQSRRRHRKGPPGPKGGSHG